MAGPESPPVPSTGIELRLLETPGELAQVEDLERVVWPGSELEVVPTHLLLAVAHNGGLVAGAFDGDRLAGFVFGFLAYRETPMGRRLKHHSHQLGVHPNYRSAGVGFALKRFQWQFVRRQGLDLITWTYDPLLARNAHLNIRKLGAVCNTFFRDVYGELRDGLNAGLPTDRFQVDWWVNNARVTALMEGARVDRLGPAELEDAAALRLNPPGADGLPRPPQLAGDAGASTDCVLVDIPGDFLALKTADPSLALTWRLAIRSTFEGLFGAGYAVADFVRAPDRATYVLRRSSQS